MTTTARSTLLRQSGTAAASDSKTVRVYEVEVPAGLGGLALRFDYGPRTATDAHRNTELVEAALARHEHRREAIRPGTLAEHRREVGGLYRALNNLMNVVLIDPAGRWRGRWDRNPTSDAGELLLSRDRCSKGFVPGAIDPGRWTVAVECHGVFGDPVSYDVRLDGLGTLAGQAALADAAATAAVQPARERRGPGWRFGEMHSHSLHSDGKHEVAELAGRAAALGLDFLALTDHNTTSGLLEDKGLPLTLLPGCELTTFHGHHPIYGPREIIPWHRDGRVLPLAELAPLVRSQGGLVSVAHPFKVGDPICTGCRMPDDLDPSSFDLLEVWYRRWDGLDCDNEASYALWNELWRGGRRVTAVASRDWHGPGQEGPFPGPMAFTGVYTDGDSPEAILEGLRRGRVILSGGPILDFWLQAASGQRAQVGESLRAREATAHVEVRRLDGPAELRLFRRGERVRSIELAGDGSHAYDGVVDRPGWYRAELWQGELPRCLTNHVLVE